MSNFKSAFILLLTISYFITAFSMNFNIKSFRPDSFNMREALGLGPEEDQNKVQEETAASVLVKVLKRIPQATLSTAEVSFESFLSTALIVMPVGLLMNLGTRPFSVPVVAKNVVKVAVEWASISAGFVGGEEFVRRMRDVDDKWNMCFGSAIASSFLRVKEGPVAMAQGFVLGFAFVYTLDRLMLISAGPNEVSTVPAPL